MAIQLEKRHFTVDEYQRMAETGILHEDDRIELLEGEIVKMTSIGMRHVACVNRLNMLLTGCLGNSAIVSVQNSVAISAISAPQPDIAVLRPREDFYVSSRITPVDIMLLIEVADTSIGYDRAFKIPLYARAGVVEVWLVDLQAGVVTRYNQPISSGYKVVIQAQGSRTVASQSIPTLSVNVSDITG